MKRQYIFAGISAITLMAIAMYIAPETSAHAFGHRGDHNRSFHERFQNLTPEQQRELSSVRHYMRERKADLLAQFLGITSDELGERRQNGDTLHETLEEFGRTHQELHEFMQEQHRNNAETEGFWQRLFDR